MSLVCAVVHIGYPGPGGCTTLGKLCTWPLQIEMWGKSALLHIICNCSIFYYLRRLWYTIYTSNWECSHWRQCYLTKAGWMGFPISHSQKWRNSCGISGSSFSWNLSKCFPLSETRYSSFAAALGLSLHPDDKVIPSIVVNNSENAHVCPSALEGLSAWHIAYVASKMLWNDEVGGGCLRCSSVCSGWSSWQDAR